VTSSAPARPWLDSCSDMAVKPEMSTNASVPSTSSHASSGLDRSQSIVRRGTNETSSAALSDRSLSVVVVISGIVRRSRGCAKVELQALARDEGWLLIAPDGLGDLVVELFELVVRAHGIVVEHRQLAHSCIAREGCCVRNARMTPTEPARVLLVRVLRVV